MPKLEELTVEKLQELKEVWLNAWCVATQSRSIRDTELAAIYADASVQNYARSRQYYPD